MVADAAVEQPDAQDAMDNTDLTADWEVDFDDVRLTATAVPEPAATAIVLASGCLLLAWFRRRRTS